LQPSRNQGFFFFGWLQSSIFKNVNANTLLFEEGNQDVLVAK